MRIGYFLSCEEHGPTELVELAIKAQDAGFEDLWISDHFHPWNDEQGHSPFVWSVIGAIAQATSGMKLTTAVTCPTLRMHPALIAQAAATATIQLEGRFCLGVGSGEALNEHIFSDRWRGADERLEMLEEAVEVIRTLWKGGFQDHRGRHYRVENCRIYDLRELKVCWDEDQTRAVKTVHRLWPNDVLPGELAQILPSPRHFEQATELVTEAMLAEATTCGPDLDRHLAAIREYADLGFDELYIQQIGPRQDGFFEVYREHVLPQAREELSAGSPA